ncbi:MULTISPECIES: hypothetical protein [unclassified Chelatococcus]|uniref:hypothetical protein n=1 Tax=unclassified Chelatococcus TaxID=2638111 RepID=UPI001BD15D60|nr:MULTISPECIES: hypothetical protein [unclassified Chelatococcus]MBS7700380.1 hypothetical protein [Chelatococcus sp. YT9]MBX3556176.1 hypothetical protein [Chelatococcus sp.]
MTMDVGGEVVWGIGIVLLLAALVWGTIQSATRKRANDRIAEEATRQEYEDPAHYPEKRKELEKKVDRS